MKIGVRDLVVGDRRGVGRIIEVKPHVSFEDKEQLKLVVKRYWLTKKQTKRYVFIRDRDVLFIEFLWQTGMRVTDALNIKYGQIDEVTKMLTYYVKKRKLDHVVPLDSELVLDLKNYCMKYDLDVMFGMDRRTVWEFLKKYGTILGLRVHPHMFRHGLAMHLKLKGWDDVFIAARLGHSSSDVTRKFYQKVTPDMQKGKMLEDIRSPL